MNLELFNIGFLTIRLVDVIDIILVSLIFYRIYITLRGSVAGQIFIGLILILVIAFSAKAFHLRALNWIFSVFIDYWMIVFLILLQPEIRKILISSTKNMFVKFFFGENLDYVIDEISSAVIEMSKKKIGALIIFVRGTGLKFVSETGIQLKAEVSRSLLLSIFQPKSPLHDGGVIIEGILIDAARCTLPFTSKVRFGDEPLGLRHRAAIGITEQTDAIAVVVSEETGRISIAEDGVINRNISSQDLRRELKERFTSTLQRSLRT